MNEILDKIIEFDVEVAKSQIPTDLYKQMDKLQDACDHIEKYLTGTLKNVPEGSRSIEMIVAEFQRIKNHILKRSFIKDKNKEIKILTAQISEGRSHINSTLKTLKSYVIENAIVLK